MGAQAFIVENEAASAYEAYNNLVAIAIQGHGDDSYNGTISTCQMGRCTKSLPNLKEKFESIFIEEE